jgi:hypothetical protein
MKNLSPILLSLFFIVVFLFSSIGCNSDSLDRTTVQGTVKINGTPVTTGNIAFYPKRGTECPSISGLIKDGHYSIPRKNGPVPGNFTVKISATKQIPGKVKDRFGNETDGVIIKSILPAQYDPMQGGKKILEAQISKGKNIIDFDLND